MIAEAEENALGSFKQFRLQPDSHQTLCLATMAQTTRTAGTGADSNPSLLGRNVSSGLDAMGPESGRDPDGEHVKAPSDDSHSMLGVDAQTLSLAQSTVSLRGSCLLD
jgi:hypothetical protein